MATRDPNFWKRFSIAVHQDELLKSEMSLQTQQQNELKHSYVSSSPLSSAQPSSIPGSCTESPPMPAPPMATLPRERPTLDNTLRAGQSAHPKPKRPLSRLQKTPSTRPLLRPTQYSSTEPPSPIALASPYTHHAHDDLAPQPPPPTKLFHHNFSTLSLSLHNGPPGSFKFWTTITADAPRRDSWLVSQKRKARQRTWMCWLFWTGFLALVAAVVVTVLVLKAKGIL